jgi:hypothetical protein
MSVTAAMHLPLLRLVLLKHRRLTVKFLARGTTPTTVVEGVDSRTTLGSEPH